MGLFDGSSGTINDYNRCTSGYCGADLTKTAWAACSYCKSIFCVDCINSHEKRCKAGDFN